MTNIEGWSKEKIANILEKKLAQDYNYESGYILGSMCSEPLDFAKEIYLKYISKNLGDPGLFQGAADLEKELISEIGELFGGKNITGTITSGGSEANLIAMRIARKLRPDIKKPEFIISKSAHISFNKGEEIMGGSITLRKIDLKNNFEINLEQFEKLLNKNTCGVLGIAGTTSLGLIDPIEQIGKIIEGKEIFFHVDAAFGGFVLPFLKKLGYKLPKWDFSVKEVDSITADPHKMGLGIIPTGGYFIRDPKILSRTGFEIPYLAGGNFKHFNILGTRPGGQVIAFWAIMKYLGVEGFTKIVKQCMENTNYLVNLLSEINGIHLVTNPIMNIVGITTEKREQVSILDEELRKKNWMLGKFNEFNIIRVVVMPHVKKDHLFNFAQDLEAIAKKHKL